MLVLSRKRDERIVINENIVITVVDIRGDKVRIGIEAPSTMPVHRSEVYDAIRKHEAEEQAKSPPSWSVIESRPADLLATSGLGRLG